MATRTGTVIAVTMLRGSDNLIAGEPTIRVYGVLVDNQSGSSVIGGTDTLRVASLVTSVSGFLRDGKTRTVVGGAVAPYQPGVGSDGTAYGFTTSLSTAQLDITPKSITDWSTGATLPSGSMDRPFGIVVMMQEV